MKEIRLYGILGKTFGKSFKLAVNTPAEAIRALQCIIPGLKEFIRKDLNSGYHIFLGKNNDIGEQELEFTTSSDIIKIVPATIGSGGLFKAILGVALLFTPVGWGLSTTVAYGMILSGISEILFAPPKNKGAGHNEKPENTPSYIFNGAINTVGQGNPVPLAYGKIRVGSQVISAGMSAREIPMTTAVVNSNGVGKFNGII